MTAQTHALYRFFNALGDLLYVGITMNPAARWPQHRQEKAWWTEVTDISVETFKSRGDALDAERQAIKTEHPHYNVVHAERPILPAPARITWRCECCDELIEDGDGCLGVSGADMGRFYEEMESWQLARANEPYPTGTLLRTYPEPIHWAAAHWSLECELSIDAYYLGISNVRTPAQLLAITAHLMGKRWFGDSDWDQILKYAAGAA